MICDLASTSSVLNVASSSGSVGGTADPSMCFHNLRVFSASVMRNFQCQWLLEGLLSLGIDPMKVDVVVRVCGALGWGVVVGLVSGMLIRR